MQQYLSHASLTDDRRDDKPINQRTWTKRDNFFRSDGFALSWDESSGSWLNQPLRALLFAPSRKSGARAETELVQAEKRQTEPTTWRSTKVASVDGHTWLQTAFRPPPRGGELLSPRHDRLRLLHPSINIQPGVIGRCGVTAGWGSALQLGVSTETAAASHEITSLLASRRQKRDGPGAGWAGKVDRAARGWRRILGDGGETKASAKQTLAGWSTANSPARNHAAHTPVSTAYSWECPSSPTKKQRERERDEVVSLGLPWLRCRALSILFI